MSSESDSYSSDAELSEVEDVELGPTEEQGINPIFVPQEGEKVILQRKVDTFVFWKIAEIYL